MSVKINRPILVTGSHRSGTTWVGQMIAMCPEVAYINEPFNPVTYQVYRGICGAEFVHWNTYINSENQNDFYQGIKNTLEFKYNLLGQLSVTKKFDDLKLLKQQYLFSKYKRQNLIPLMKDPLAIFATEWLTQEFNMKPLILIRHPAAFVYSVKKAGWRYNFSGLLEQPLLLRDYLSSFEQEILEYSKAGKSLVEEAALIWKIIYHVVSIFQSKYPEWIYLKYESLAKDPIPMFKNLFNTLDLDFSPSTEMKIREYTDPSNPTESDVTSLMKRNSLAIIDTWKSKLSQEEIKQIRNQVEEVSSIFYSDEDW